MQAGIALEARGYRTMPKHKGYFIIVESCLHSGIAVMIICGKDTTFEGISQEFIGRK